jgi:hypothetical protein
MRRLLYIILVFVSSSAMAQLGNSWIDYNKTYYKFQVANDGLYRINQPALAAAGLSTIPAENFQLWRNGQQVRIYTSTPAGAMGASDYIDFWGQRNDGKPDTKLYRQPDYQLSDHYSLETDTAAYFLTVNTSGGNLRYTNTANNVTGTTLPIEPYFMNTKGVYYRNYIDNGKAIVFDFYLYSSSYDQGEGLSSNEIYSGTSAGLTMTLDNLNIYTGGPGASFKMAAAGTSPTNYNETRNIKVTITNSGTVLVNDVMNNFDYLKKNVTGIPISSFPNTNSASFLFENVSSINSATERMVVSFGELTYPSTFNFNNSKNFVFQLAASATGKYLIIDNFSYGSTAPVLLDVTNGYRYVGDISTPGKVKFVTQPSGTTAQYVLVNEENSNVNTVSTLTTRAFKNITQQASQGNYIIISNPVLYNDGSGQNYVDQYRAYRASAPGGGYNAKVFDIDELTDEFGFGIKNHPASIKDFVIYSKNNFTVAPQYIFLIGKGVNYAEYYTNQTSPLAPRLNLVPTFGYPASDILLSSNYGSTVPLVPIGRLSAVNAGEVNAYLKKMIQYEQAQQSTLQTVDNKAWMKNVVHVIGGKTEGENSLFTYFMDKYKDIIQDTLYGAKVETFSKSSTLPVQLISGERIKQLFHEGISILSYFGHSSANVLEFNLNTPQGYDNQGKYPFFNVSGCTAGNNYTFDFNRFNGNQTISEQFVLADQLGAIGFLASTHLGLPTNLDNYNVELYKQIASLNYGRPIGVIMQAGLQDQATSPSFESDMSTRMHAEEINLHGDPALKINSHAKPDYVIEDQLVNITPSFISVAQGTFAMKAKIMNIGKAINDSIVVQVRRIFPNNAGSEIALRKKIAAPHYADSIAVNFQIIGTRDKGLSKIEIRIDADNKVDELDENNNVFVKDIFIFENEARPTYPYDYSIINNNIQKLYASTADPFSPAQQYAMEIDTTELFNSPAKVNKTLTATGGILEFAPGITYQDNTVYYWRVAIVPSSGPYTWNNASFIYLANSSPGFNQSHYYQKLHNSIQQMAFDGKRELYYLNQPRTIEFRTGLYPYYDFPDIDVRMDGGDRIEHYGCKYNSLQFMVFDSGSLVPWRNLVPTPPATNGLYGSEYPCDAPGGFRYFFEFRYTDPTYRKRAMDFIDQIPNGWYVSITNLGMNTNTSFIDEWKNDTLLYGSGNSLYHKLKSIGFTGIDQFTSNKPFLYFFQKGTPTFTPSQTVGAVDEHIDKTFSLTSRFGEGTIQSALFGPAKAWKEMHWRGYSLETAPNDKPTVDIIGVDYLGNHTLLNTVDQTIQDLNISNIDASVYPYIQLQLHDKDTISYTPYQLTYWRLNYDPAPEGAIAANLFLQKKDTLSVGEPLNFGIAFKNISPTAFADSIKMKAYIIDEKNRTTVINLPKQKPLVSGDTIKLQYTVDTRSLTGSNTLYIDFNPDNAQPEQYHFNNFLYANFYVKGDVTNPLMDVTFDGVHILNNDIVSSRPHITIKLKDENKFLALNDPSLLKVQLGPSDGSSLRTYSFGTDTLRFIPADPSKGENTATIEFNPVLTGDNVAYKLVISGKDVIGNPAFNANGTSYSINFRVFEKAMISNLLNYPNPFTTSTAFVFTLTGSEIPQNMRIQILTITGKIVKEITKEELGNIHVGRNITDYKWDGRDMYGQKLANGVYLYRVLTNLQGKSLEKFKDSGDETDKYFTKGYGKMYLMR